jgi:hypothetical protein
VLCLLVTLDARLLLRREPQLCLVGGAGAVCLSGLQLQGVQIARRESFGSVHHSLQKDVKRNLKQKGIGE